MSYHNVPSQNPVANHNSDNNSSLKSFFKRGRNQILFAGFLLGLVLIIIGMFLPVDVSHDTNGIPLLSIGARFLVVGSCLSIAFIIVLIVSLLVIFSSPSKYKNINPGQKVIRYSKSLLVFRLVALAIVALGLILFLLFNLYLLVILATVISGGLNLIVSANLNKFVSTQEK